MIGNFRSSIFALGNGTAGPSEQTYKKPPQNTTPSRDTIGSVPGPCCSFLCHGENWFVLECFFFPFLKFYSKSFYCVVDAINVCWQL